MYSFIKKYPHDPLIATVGDGGDKIVVYLHKRIKDHGFPDEYQGIPVLVRFIGKVKPA